MKPNDDLLTRKEAAVYLRVSVSWLAHGNGPKPIKFGTKKKFYLKRDCDTFIEERRNAACCTSEKAQASGGANSSSPAKSSENLRERQIERELRRKLVESKSNMSKIPSIDAKAEPE